jgi:hypothetical protein
LSTASKQPRPKRLAVGDRVVARGWRHNLAWQAKGTVIHTYHSAIDGPIVVVLTDIPEPDGSAVFDLMTTDVSPTRSAGRR